MLDVNSTCIRLDQVQAGSSCQFRFTKQCVFGQVWGWSGLSDLGFSEFQLVLHLEVSDQRRSPVLAGHHNGLLHSAPNQFQYWYTIGHEISSLCECVRRLNAGDGVKRVPLIQGSFFVAESD